MTGQIEPQSAPAARVDRKWLLQAGVAVVFGAGGGIRGALLAAVQAAERFDHVVAFSRSTSPSIDPMAEASLDRAAVVAAELGELRLVIDATRPDFCTMVARRRRKAGGNSMRSSSLEPLR